MLFGLKTADVFRILITTTGVYLVFMVISQIGSTGYTTVEAEQQRQQVSLSDLGVVNFREQARVPRAPAAGSTGAAAAAAPPAPSAAPKGPGAACRAGPGGRRCHADAVCTSGKCTCKAGHIGDGRYCGLLRHGAEPGSTSTAAVGAAAPAAPPLPSAAKPATPTTPATAADPAAAAGGRIVVGVFMVESPEMRLRRIAFRQLYLPWADRIDLRFIICRPSAATAKEPDVVGIDMRENVNKGKTYEYFKWAHATLRGRPAYYKCDVDSVFCPDALVAFDTTHVGKYYYVGRQIHPGTCNGHQVAPNVRRDKAGDQLCPPRHCTAHSWVGECWVHHSGGFYGMSWPLLGAVMESTWTHEHGRAGHGHEDVWTGKWINNTTPEVRAQLIGVKAHSQAVRHTKRSLIKLDEAAQGQALVEHINDVVSEYTATFHTGCPAPTGR